MCAGVPDRNNRNNNNNDNTNCTLKLSFKIIIRHNSLIHDDIFEDLKFKEISSVNLRSGLNFSQLKLDLTIVIVCRCSWARSTAIVPSQPTSTRRNSLNCVSVCRRVKNLSSWTRGTSVTTTQSRPSSFFSQSAPSLQTSTTRWDSSQMVFVEVNSGILITVVYA